MSNYPLRISDFVVGTRDGEHLLHTYILYVQPSYFATADDEERIWLVSEEGTTWIRGLHAPDSSEVRALLTAYALSRSAA